jgi:hypothetical protein
MGSIAAYSSGLRRICSTLLRGLPRVIFMWAGIARSVWSSSPASASSPISASRSSRQCPVPRAAPPGLDQNNLDFQIILGKVRPPVNHGHKTNLWLYKTGAPTQHCALSEPLMASPHTTARRIEK